MILRIKERGCDLVVVSSSSGIDTETPNGFKMFGRSMNKDSKNEFKFGESFCQLSSIRFIGESDRSSVISNDSSG